ncbi:MAG: ATP synthase F1 subunit gamma [Bdellovibrionales bacterium]|nr:ATP synthase F1 subunit gamma [Bdellovibrionales bacterium]
MPSLKDIRSRIASVKNTQQITRAMKMVSAAKLRRAQHNIVNMRPYANKILSVIADIAITHRVTHPLLSPSASPRKVLVVVVTSDRGLCGGFNANVNKFAERFHRENSSKYETLDILFIGRKGADYFRRRGLKGVDTITNLAREISYVLAASIAERLMKSYSEGGYDEIRLVYNEFKSAISQNLVCETLLPIDLSRATLGSQTDSKFSKDLLFEPPPEEIVDDLLHKHFAVQVYRCLSESVAAEHAARMTAMENATNNAKEMIGNLTLTYNKLRQASITKELIEICSGAEALKG